MTKELEYEIIGARKRRLKGKPTISLRLQHALTTNPAITVTTNIHIDPIPDYKKLIGQKITLTVGR